MPLVMYRDRLRGSVSPHTAAVWFLASGCAPSLQSNVGLAPSRQQGAFLHRARCSAFSLTSSAVAGSARRLCVTQTRWQQLARLTKVWGGERERSSKSPHCDPRRKENLFKMLPQGVGEGEDGAGVSQLGVSRAAI